MVIRKIYDGKVVHKFVHDEKTKLTLLMSECEL